MNLSAFQKRELHAIIDERLRENSVWNNIREQLNTMNVDRHVQDKVHNVVPPMCQEWVNCNMKSMTENIADNYMRNNFGRFFKKEIAENTDVDGFIESHLKIVEMKVNEASSESVKKVLDTSTVFNPIFQQHLNVLSERNKSLLEKQSEDIRKSKDNLDAVVSENKKLSQRLSSLEKTNSSLFGISFFTIMCVFGLGLNIFRTRTDPNM